MNPYYDAEPYNILLVNIMASGIDGKWELLNAGGQAFQPGTVFEFENGKYHYRYGNQHNGTFHLEGDAIKVGPGMSTKMMSFNEPPEHFLEQQFDQAKTWAING